MEPSEEQPNPSIIPIPLKTKSSKFIVAIGVVIVVVLLGAFVAWKMISSVRIQNQISTTTLTTNTTIQPTSVADVDKTKLTSINKYYAKDDAHVYSIGYNGDYYTLADADSSAFRIYSDKYPWVGLDARHIYVSGQEVAKADVASFVVLDSNYAKDKNTFYSICVGEECDFGPIPDIDAKTYVLLSNSSTYAKDANRYYDGGVPLVGIATSTFVVINDFYAKDSKRVYYGASPIEGADPATFASVDGHNGWYAKDANHVYIRGYLEKELSPTGFSVISQIYSKDAHIVYFDNGVDESKIIQGADPSTFTPLTTENPSYGSYSGLPDSLWAKDAKHVYFGGDALADADPSSFIVLNGRYGKDTTHGYIMDKILPGVDVVSFVGLQETIWYAKDKYHVWTGSKIIQGADPATFVVVSPDQSCGTNCTYRAYDKNHKYYYNGAIVQ